MIIGILCLIIFLFVTYQLAKDDFLFLRRNITLDEIFNALFIGLPFALLFSRVFYIAFHPSWKYLNPLVFIAVPYFPGLSLIGGITGAWLFLSLYALQKKLPTKRLIDIVSIAFLFSVSIGIFLEGIVFLFSTRLVGVEEIGISMLGIAFFIFLLTNFTKNALREGNTTYLSIGFYCFLSLLTVGLTMLQKRTVSFSSAGFTTVILLVCIFLFLKSYIRTRLKR